MTHWHDTMVDRPETDGAVYVTGWTISGLAVLGTVVAVWVLGRDRHREPSGLGHSARRGYRVRAVRQGPGPFPHTSLNAPVAKWRVSRCFNRKSPPALRWPGCSHPQLRD
jgi:hypothetical protein